MAVVYNILSHHVLKKGELKIYFNALSGFVNIDIDDKGSFYYETLQIHYSTLKDILHPNNFYNITSLYNTKEKSTKTYPITSFKDDKFTVFKLKSKLSDVKYERWQFREDEIEYLLKIANEKGKS